MKKHPFLLDVICGTKSVADGFGCNAADQYEVVMKEHGAARFLSFADIDDHALFLPFVQVVLIIDRVQSEDTADLMGVKISPLKQANHFHISNFLSNYYVGRLPEEPSYFIMIFEDPRQQKAVGI